MAKSVKIEHMDKFDPSMLPSPADSLKPIKIEDFPTFPAPWDSIDAGELWIWDDYFLVFQTAPVTKAELPYKNQNKNFVPGSMRYNYALLIYYRGGKNPAGDSREPVMAITLEQSFNHLLPASIREEYKLPDGPCPEMLCMWLAGQHLNFGEYKNKNDRDSVRYAFFQLFARQRSLASLPQRAGAMDDAFGNPLTGYPKKDKGWLGVVLILLICMGFAIFMGR